MRLHTSRPVFRGFTLIELLTVIAIIGILAAIIIPTVGRVRESARASQCISNQRQLAMAFGLYANDNKGFLPRSNQPIAWNLAISPYIPARNGTVVSDKVFICPTASPQPPEGFTGSVVHYIVSLAVEANSSVGTGSGTGPRQLTSISNPSRAILLTDGWVDPATYRSGNGRNYTQITADFNQPDPTNEAAFHAVSFRHNLSMNVAYVDGSARRVSWGDRFAAIPDALTWSGRK